MKKFFLEVMPLYGHGVVIEFLLFQFKAIENFSTSFLIANLCSALAIAVISYFYSNRSTE